MNWIKQSSVILIIKVLVTAVALGFVLSQIPVKQLFQILIHAKISLLLLATLLFILSKYFSSIRLHRVFANAGIEISAEYNFYLYVLGMLYNFILPSGVGGDAYKVLKIERDFNYTHKHIATVVFFDRISGLVALCNIACILFTALFYISYLLHLVLILILLNAAFYFLLSKIVAFRLFVLKTELFSWGVQILQSVCAYCICLSLNIHEHIFVYVCIFLISSIVSVLPISIGGLGAREYTFMIAAGYLSIEQDKAVCIGLLFYIITLLVSLSGIYFLFKPITKKSHYVSE